MPKTKKEKEFRSCNVVSNECVAPAGFGISGAGHYVSNREAGDRETKATCFGCGMPVCVKCSKRVKWYNHGRQRICFDCKPELEEEAS